MVTSSRIKLNCSSMLSTNRKMKSWVNCACIIVGVLSLTAYSTAQQHFQRRPITTSSAGMDAYRNRWMAYIRRQSTPKPATQSGPTKAGEQTAQIVNGFHCTRIHAFFTTEDNPRMYHLCARNRDSWYVYHFFCPPGSIFDESMKKCSMPRRASTSPTSRPLIMSTPGTSRTTARSVIQSSSLTTTMLTTRPATGFASYLGLNGFFNRPTSSVSTTKSTTTTTEIPEAIPEPNATEMFASSEESTEEEMMGVKNVFVNIPGLTMSTSSATPLDDDDDGNEEVTTEIDTPNDEESNVIPESGGVIGNEPVALENSLAYQLQQAVSMHNKTNPSKTMEIVASILKASSASKGRRPRVPKQNKWHYYRFLN